MMYKLFGTRLPAVMILIMLLFLPVSEGSNDPLVAEVRRQVGDEVEEARLGRVIGGEEAKEGMWPWLVSLQAKVPKDKLLGITLTYMLHYCGGSLIAPHWILSAAHCFVPQANKPEYWHVRMGDTDLTASIGEKVKGFFGKLFNKNEWREWTMHIDKIIIHPEYNKEDLWANDIALLHLSEAAPHGPEVPEVQIIKLPQSGSHDFPKPEHECVMKGWGCLDAGGSVSDVAHFVSLPPLSDTQCRHVWGIDITIRLCAGYLYRQMGVCKGDSGGPLVCRYNNSSPWMQAGVVSFSSKDKPGDFPGVFVRVSHYIDWIQQTMANN